MKIKISLVPVHLWLFWLTLTPTLRRWRQLENHFFQKWCQRFSDCFPDSLKVETTWKLLLSKVISKVFWLFWLCQSQYTTLVGNPKIGTWNFITGGSNGFSGWEMGSPSGGPLRSGWLYAGTLEGSRLVFGSWSVVYVGDAMVFLWLME